MNFSVLDKFPYYSSVIPKILVHEQWSYINYWKTFLNAFYLLTMITLNIIIVYHFSVEALNELIDASFKNVSCCMSKLKKIMWEFNKT